MPFLSDHDAAIDRLAQCAREALGDGGTLIVEVRPAGTEVHVTVDEYVPSAGDPMAISRYSGGVVYRRE